MATNGKAKGNAGVMARAIDFDVYGALLAEATSPSTVEARAYDVATFARFIGSKSPAEAVATLCGGTAGQARALVKGFRADQLARGKSPATTNRKLCTLRRAVLLAREMGALDWNLEVSGVPELRGHADDADEVRWRRMLDWSLSRANGGSAKGTRDHAMLAVMFFNGLRAGEVVALDRADLDLSQERLRVASPGPRAKLWVSLTVETVGALTEWLSNRGKGPGPLFCRLGRPDELGRLVKATAHELVCKARKAADRAMKPGRKR